MTGLKPKHCYHPIEARWRASSSQLYCGSCGREIAEESTRPDTPEAMRRSMRTMFEFRARAWLVWGVILIVLALLAYLITRTLVPIV